MAVDEESVAATTNGVMAVPETLDWFPGLVTVTVLVTVQVKLVVPKYPSVSVAVMVTEEVPAVVGVPLITPVEVLIDQPGREGALLPSE